MDSILEIVSELHNQSSPYSPITHQFPTAQQQQTFKPSYTNPNRISHTRPLTIQNFILHLLRLRQPILARPLIHRTRTHHNNHIHQRLKPNMIPLPTRRRPKHNPSPFPPHLHIHEQIQRGRRRGRKSVLDNTRRRSRESSRSSSTTTTTKPLHSLPIIIRTTRMPTPHPQPLIPQLVTRRDERVVVAAARILDPG